MCRAMFLDFFKLVKRVRGRVCVLRRHHDLWAVVNFNHLFGVQINNSPAKFELFRAVHSTNVIAPIWAVK